jgi:hypothetical protein
MRKCETKKAKWTGIIATNGQIKKKLKCK